MILAVDDVYLSLAVHYEGPGIAEPARLTSRTSPAAERTASGRELLHSLVAVLHHVEVAARPKCQVVGIREFPRSVARRTEAADESAVLRVKDLDAMIAGVGDIKQAIGAQR